MVMNDRWIMEMAAKGMIEPFSKEQAREGVISSGVSAYGYDMSIADEFKLPIPGSDNVIDPKESGGTLFYSLRGETCLIPANSFAICRSVEYFRIPREVLAVCFGKSTYARSGVVVNVTPLEPEWEGHVTISISNTAPFPVKLYANEGIAQVVFLKAAEVCTTSYADKKGKYQAAKGIQHSKI